jgi:hypothetical protein
VAKLAAQQKAAQAEPPFGTNCLALAKFYDQRAVAADDLGRLGQALGDEQKAYELIQPFRESAFQATGNPPGGYYAFIAQNLGRAENRTGDLKSFEDLVQSRHHPLYAIAYAGWAASLSVRVLPHIGNVDGAYRRYDTSE